MKLDGTELTTVAEEAVYEPKNPAWSPDSAYIAYAANANIYIRPAAGGEAKGVFEQYPALKASLGSFGRLAYQIAWTR